MLDFGGDPHPWFLNSDRDPHSEIFIVQRG